MKKFFKLFFATAVIPALTLVSCNNKDDNNKPDNGSDFSEVVAEYVTSAQKIELPVEAADDAPVVTTNDGAIVKAIEFTESGYAIITKLVPVRDKADDDVTYEEVVFVTTFTVNGTTYTVTGFGNVTVSTNSEGDTTITITATATSGDNAVSENVEVVAEDVTKNDNPQTGKPSIFKSWKITVTEVEAKGGSLDKNGVRKKFNGKEASSLKLIAEWLEDKGVKVDVKDLNQYEIESVTLTEAGTFMIKFNIHEPYVGEFKLSGSSFTYEFQQGGNSVINAKANGTVVVSDKGVGTLSLNGTVDNGNDHYTTKIVLTLEPVSKV